MKHGDRRMCARCMDFTVVGLVLIAITAGLCGCRGNSSYSNESLYPEKIGSVYVEMFNSKSFRRGIEYGLTDAVSKRIESQTPYKVVSNRDKADSVISGELISASQSVLTAERETGRSLENEVLLRAVVNWKDLKTGELMVDSTQVSASASYSQWQSQGYAYGSLLAANNLADRIVELMEKQW